MTKDPPDSTRQKVLKGGIYIATRRLIGALLGIIGALFITNLVGPGAYGIFNSALGFQAYCQSLGRLGLNVYLIRQREDDSWRPYHVTFTFYIIESIIFSALAILFVVFVLSLWVNEKDFIRALVLMICSLPLQLASLVPQSYLERILDYKKTTTVEIASQLGYYLVALPLAFSGFGVWALISGFWAQVLIQTIGTFVSARYSPRWTWSFTELRPMLAYGAAQAFSSWLYQLRNLGPSMILLPLAGKEAAGHLALALRFLGILSFAKDAAWRISIPALAKVQDEPRKMLNAVKEGMYLQVLLLGLIYAGFAFVIPWVVPLAIRGEWDMQLLSVAFVFSAFGYFVNSIFTMPASALYVKQHVMIVSFYNLSHSLSFLIGGQLLVPSLGLWGYGLAEFIALPAYGFLVYGMARHIGSVDYRVTALWLAGFTLALFAPVVSGWLYLASVPFLVNPISLRTLRDTLSQIKQTRSPSRQADKR